MVAAVAVVYALPLLRSFSSSAGTLDGLRRRTLHRQTKAGTLQIGRSLGIPTSEIVPARPGCRSHSLQLRTLSWMAATSERRCPLSPQPMDRSAARYVTKIPGRKPPPLRNIMHIPLCIQNPHSHTFKTRTMVVVGDAIWMVMD